MLSDKEERLMEKQQQFVSKLPIKDPIPYYSNRFHSLIRVLEEKTNKLHDQHLGFLPEAEYEVIISGITYYYEIIMSEGNLSDEEKKKLCAKLVESTNQALYVLFNEIDDANDTDVKNYLIAYREYLQSIQNDFRKEKKAQGIDAPRLIFTFSLELLGNKVHIDSLFTTIYESKADSLKANLCCVFAPSDIEIKDVFCYLPMLTHEISHNFRYSEPYDRNEFVVNYLLRELSKMIVRQMFFNVSDYNYTPFLGKAENILVDALAEVFKNELLVMEPDCIVKGHLDHLPSLIFSVICATFPTEEQLEVFYNVRFPYYILQKSFITLSKFSDLKWYVADKTNESHNSDEEIIASLLLDLFSIKDRGEIKSAYQKVSLVSSDNHVVFKEMLNQCDNNTTTIDMEAVNIAFEEIILSVIEKISCEFQELRNQYNTDTNLVDDVLLSLIDSNVKFYKSVENLLNNSKDEHSQMLYDFCDKCCAARNCVDNIINIAKLNDNIKESSRVNQIILKIYKRLRDTVEISLKDKSLKPHFVTRNMNSALIKLGLYNDENSPEVFYDQYASALEKWGRTKIGQAIDDYLSVYREIFADLSMCAAFEFNQLGYLRYMTEQFRNVREMGDFYARDMALDRMHVVLKVLEEKCEKQSLNDLYSKDIQSNFEWTDEWNLIVKSYLDDDRKGEYDERYKAVYYEKILPSEWIKNLQNNEIVKMIGQYYNNLESVSSTEKEEMCEKFLNKYTSLFKNKCDIRDNSKEKSVNILLGETIYDEP